MPDSAIVKRQFRTRGLIAAIPPELAPEANAQLQWLVGQAIDGAQRLSCRRDLISFPGSDAEVTALLEHELSDAFEERHGRQNFPRRSRTLSERDALKAWTLSCENTIRISEIAELNKLIEPAGGFRSDAGLLLGTGKEAIILPPVEDAIANLENILAVGIPSIIHPAQRLLGAIHEFVGINNSHVFKDGNGRTARAILNHRLQQIFGIKIFIALKEFFSLSRGAYEINLRRAELVGDYFPLAAFIATILTYCLSHEQSRTKH